MVICPLLVSVAVAMEFSLPNQYILTFYEGNVCETPAIGASDCIERLVAVSRVSILSGNVFTQAAVSRFCDQGSYEKHIRRVHKVYRGRMQTLLRSLKACMPTGVTWGEPAGGYTLLLRVRSTGSEGRVLPDMRKAGVLLSTGSLYFPVHPTFCASACPSPTSPKLSSRKAAAAWGAP